MREDGRVPSEPGYSAEPEPLSGVSALSGEYPSRGAWIWQLLATCGITWLVFSGLAAIAGTAAAMWFAGGFLCAALLGLWEAGRYARRDSDGSPKGGDGEAGSVHDSAGPKGIAR